MKDREKKATMAKERPVRKLLQDSLMAHARGGFKMVKSVHSDKGTPYKGQNFVTDAKMGSQVTGMDNCMDGADIF